MAAKELEKKTNILEEIECKVQIQKGIVEKERKSLDAVRLRVQEVCQKCYLPPASGCVYGSRRILDRV